MDWGVDPIVVTFTTAQAADMAKKYNRAEAVDFWDKLDGCEFPAVGIRGGTDDMDMDRPCGSGTDTQAAKQRKH